ncbi:MAG: argininosuccinate lyase [Pirellulales bacterium]
MKSPARSGVFQQGTDRRVELFTESISFDHRLLEHDVRASRAHAQMLAAVGLLTAAEQQQIDAALESIRDELNRGVAEGRAPWRIELEDVHMHVEQALIDRLGDVGRKLHTARSRNDQVSTDLRLWCRDAIDQLDVLLHNLQAAFVSRTQQDAGVILPAYTHLQRAQPVLAAHYWLAYCEKLQRDRQRLADCRRRVNVLSLGAAAVAGTTLPIDRQMVAKLLGFEDVARNSIDVSSDRDFVVELAFVLTMIAEHLSTWAEEWILWSTVEYGMLKLPQAFCTGSSIMPQKINPDVLELIRGKTARVVGALQSLLVLIKGLPLAYNRDLQEDKLPLFEAYDTVSASLAIAAPLVAGAELRRESIAARLDSGFLDATTLMEYLISRGLPQRTAHHIVGSLVATAMQAHKKLAELTLDEFRAVEPSLDESVYGVLGVEAAINAYRSYGSSHPAQVEQQCEFWRKQLGLD